MPAGSVDSRIHVGKSHVAEAGNASVPLTMGELVENGLRRLDENFITSSNEIRLFAKVRNEVERLPHFLDYYRKLGVNRFFIVDNCSTDHTVDLLKQSSDCHIFSTPQKMAEARAGMDWIEPLLKKYGENRWCLIVDADELLVYPNSEDLHLAQFCQKLDALNVNALPCMMLDMYPQGNIEDIIYRGGQSFVEASPYFDRGGYRKLPTDASLQSIVGGPRLRMFYPKLLDRRIITRIRRSAIYRIWLITKGRKLPFVRELKPHPTPPLLNKVPLVRWNEDMRLSAAAHFLDGRGARLSQASGVLLHFKFLGDFSRRVDEEMIRNAYFNNGEEYKQYFDRVARGHGIDFTCELSTRYTDSKQLLELGLIKEIEKFAE